MPYTQTDPRIAYADDGEGRPVVLIHGWPLSHRMWEYQVGPLTDAGYRCVAYDRRGFGASDTPSAGYDYDTLTADLAALIDELDLRDVTLVGFSMGGGEVARYLANHGSDRIAQAVLAAAVTPSLAESDDNPKGVPAEALEGFGAALREDRIGFLDGFTRAFFGVGPEGDPDVISEPLLRHFVDIASWAGPRATAACAEAFGGTDFTADMAAFDVPTLIVHGDADQTVPYEATARRAAEMVPDARLEIVDGAPHGLTYTHRQRFNELLLGFLAS
ncbi:MAG TPA: alpha/beta hydrolase [Iamia sp.]|nr:alpha/beta hydrolase [Iamia sp.]